MEKQSESWCSWFVSKIKSCFCPRKKHLETMPEFQTANIMNFLDNRDMMALLFVNKTLNLKTKDYRTTKFKEENLLDCIVAIWVLENDIPGGGKRFTENCIDYKTGGEFNVYDYKVRVRTLRDFAKYFVELKDSNKYKQLIKELSDKYRECPSCDESDIAKANINYVETLVSICCNKSCQNLWKERASTKKTKRHDYKKQIENYQTIMTNKSKKSYKPIYNHLKNKPNPEKPERENYIKAYEELKKE